MVRWNGGSELARRSLAAATAAIFLGACGTGGESADTRQGRAGFLDCETPNGLIVTGTFPSDDGARWPDLADAAVDAWLDAQQATFSREELTRFDGEGGSARYALSRDDLRLLTLTVGPHEGGFVVKSYSVCPESQADLFSRSAEVDR